MGGHPATESEEPEGESDSEESHFTYASQGEAERAALQTEQAVSRLSHELGEVQDLVLQVLDPQDQGQSRPPTEASETPHSFATKRRKEALDEIEALDWDAEDHKSKVAEIQSRADMDILSHHRTVEGVSREKQESAQREVNAVIDQAQKAMEDADLDSARDSMDSVFFWSLAQLIPTEKDGVPVSMDDQIAYCIDAVKNYKTKSLETHKTEETSGPAKPVTLSSVVDAIADSRRI